MMPLGHLGIPLLLPLVKKDLAIDIRFLLLGAILPDLIDKPLGHLLLPENNGRIIAHSLLFASIVLILGLRSRPMLSASIGVSIHLILDGMFLEHVTSFWPLLGPFEGHDFEFYDWFFAFKDPFILGEELMGGTLIVVFILSFGLLKKKGLARLLRTGRVGALKNHLYKKDMK